MKRTCLLFCLFLGALSARADVVFTLTPADGSLAGTAGTDVGWGYSISTTSNFVTIESISFGDLTPIGKFSTPGIPSSAASAGSPITTTWVDNISGLQYNISSLAGLFSSTQGLMTLTYDTFSDSGLNNQIGFGDTVNAKFNGDDVLASVTVNGVPPVNAVPEPTTFGFLVLMLAAFAVIRWRTASARTRAN